MYGGLDMVVQHHKLPLLLIVALALIFLMPSWFTAQGICDYYGSYYPSTPDMQEGMFYADAYNFLYGSDECYYGPYGGTHVYNMPAYNPGTSYNIPAYNKPAYSMPTYSQNTDSENATNWLNDANVFYLTGSYQQAAESYAKAVNIDPSLSKGWLNMGNALYYLGKYHASLNAYEALLKLEPQNADALAGKNKTLLALNTTSVPNSTIGVPSSV
jgi:tetratricopeptide (TPR) repeat protein